MSRSYTSSPPSASMVCRGTALLYFFFYSSTLAHLYKNGSWLISFKFESHMKYELLPANTEENETVNILH
jgi:hypothetical protein